VTPLFGLWATFKGMIAMMLGGMGSVPGAILGGFLLGVVESQATWYLGTEFRDIAAYGMLFVFLVARPGGLLGQRRAERERLALRRV
jgi:branched-chain amino acid transport system permease protein